MDENQAVTLAQKYLDKYMPDDTPIEIVGGKPLRFDTGFWHIPVRLTAEIPRRFHYHDALADSEIELMDNEHVNLLFVPVG